MACDQIIDSYDGSKDVWFLIEDPTNFTGQAFVMGVDARDICKAAFHLTITGAVGSKDMAVKVYACAGTPGVDGTPTGEALATSNVIQYTSSQEGSWVEFTFDTPFTLEASTDYCVVMKCVDTVGIDIQVSVSYDNTTPSHGGNYFDSDVGADNGSDCNFFIYYGGGWSGKICGVSSPGKVNSIEVANIGKVIGV